VGLRESLECSNSLQEKQEMMTRSSRNVPFMTQAEADNNICVACGEEFNESAERFDMDTGYLLECDHCGIYTFFDLSGNRQSTLGMVCGSVKYMCNTENQ